MPGLMYEEGQGLIKSTAGVLSWYRNAAAQCDRARGRARGLLSHVRRWKQESAPTAGAYKALAGLLLGRVRGARLPPIAERCVKRSTGGRRGGIRSPVAPPIPNNAFTVLVALQMAIGLFPPPLSKSDISTRAHKF